MYCHQCKTTARENDRFCSQCGKPLTMDQPPTHSHKNLLQWLKVSLGCFFLATIAIVAFTLLSNDMTDTVIGQLDDIRNQRITEAYDHFTSKEFQHTTSLERFRDYLNHSRIFAQNQSVRFVDRYSTHDRGSLKALLKTKQGAEIPVYYTLLLEDGNWKIDSIALDALSPDAQPQTGLIHPFHNISIEEEKP